MFLLLLPSVLAADDSTIGTIAGIGAIILLLLIFFGMNNDTPAPIKAQTKALDQDEKIVKVIEKDNSQILILIEKLKQEIHTRDRELRVLIQGQGGDISGIKASIQSLTQTIAYLSQQIAFILGKINQPINVNQIPNPGEGSDTWLSINEKIIKIIKSEIKSVKESVRIEIEKVKEINKSIKEMISSSEKSVIEKLESKIENSIKEVKDSYKEQIKELEKIRTEIRENSSTTSKELEKITETIREIKEKETHIEKLIEQVKEIRVTKETIKEKETIIKDGGADSKAITKLLAEINVRIEHIEKNMGKMPDASGQGINIHVEGAQATIHQAQDAIRKIQEGITINNNIDMSAGLEALSTVINNFINNTHNINVGINDGHNVVDKKKRILEAFEALKESIEKYNRGIGFAYQYDKLFARKMDGDAKDLAKHYSEAFRTLIRFNRHLYMQFKQIEDLDKSKGKFLEITNYLEVCFSNLEKKEKYLLSDFNEILDLQEHLIKKYPPRLSETGNKLRDIPLTSARNDLRHGQGEIEIMLSGTEKDPLDIEPATRVAIVSSKYPSALEKARRSLKIIKEVLSQV